MSLSPLKHIAAIALGSNLGSPAGDRTANLLAAIEHLRTLGRVAAVSHFHETAPVGFLDQPDFMNGAVLLETGLDPLALLHSLLSIEAQMGRDRSSVLAKGPRVIDLDLLLFDQQVFENKELTLPHPALRQRRFVLEPLAEIAGSMTDPVTGLSVSQLLAKLPA